MFSLLLQNMGFPPSISEVAIREYKTVQGAVDAILAGNGKQCSHSRDTGESSNAYVPRNPEICTILELRSAFSKS